MKIYAWPNAYSFTDKWPTEYVWIDEDYPLNGYKPEEHDKNKNEYLCKVNWGEYMRIKFERRYLLHFIYVDTLKDLFEFLKTSYEREEWFEIGYRSGIIQVDPWED